MNRQIGDAGIQQRVPTLRAILLIFEFAMGLFKKDDAVGVVEAAGNNIADKLLLKFGHAQVVGQP